MACIFLPPCHYPLSSYQFVLVDHLFDVFIYAPCFILNCVSDTHSSLPSTPSRLRILSTLEPVIHRVALCVWTSVASVSHCGQFTFPTRLTLYVNGFAVILHSRVASLHFSCAVVFACMAPAQKVWRYSCCLGDRRCASTYIQTNKWARMFHVWTVKLNICWHWELIALKMSWPCLCCGEIRRLRRTPVSAERSHVPMQNEYNIKEGKGNHIRLFYLLLFQTLEWCQELL